MPHTVFLVLGVLPAERKLAYVIPQARRFRRAGIIKQICQGTGGQHGLSRPSCAGHLRVNFSHLPGCGSRGGKNSGFFRCLAVRRRAIHDPTLDTSWHTWSDTVSVERGPKISLRWDWLASSGEYWRRESGSHPRWRCLCSFCLQVFCAALMVLSWWWHFAGGW